MKRTRPKPRPMMDAYRRENPACELWGLLRDAGIVIPIYSTRGTGVEVHHIWRLGGRKDFIENFICLAPLVHDWCHEHPQEQAVAACYSKFLKGEWNVNLSTQRLGFNPLAKLEYYDLTGIFARWRDEMVANPGCRT